MTSLLESEDLRVSIATENAVLEPVRGIELKLERGETLAIVGESGSGKSMTALAIMGLMPPRARIEAEKIEFSGRSLLGLPAKQWRAIRGDRIAMIFQHPMTTLYPCYTVGNQFVADFRQHLRLSHTEASCV